MINKPRKKHDELAKIFLTDLTIAKEFLLTYLPKEMLAKCDLNKINIEPGSYIDDELKAYCSDIVYKVDLQDQSETDCIYLYSLIEHQSRADKLMPLRIIRYQLAIIQKHLDKFKQSRVKLPLVIPLVIYNGKQSPYPYPCDISGLFADRELYQALPLGKFKLIDLTTTKDDEILRHGKLSLLEMITKHIHDRDFINIIDLVVETLRIAYSKQISETLVNSVFSYLIYAREKPEIVYLLKQLKDKLPDYEDNTMSYAEELFQEGMEKGLQEGIQKGLQEGMQKVAKNLIKTGIDDRIIARATNLTLQQIQALK